MNVRSVRARITLGVSALAAAAFAAIAVIAPGVVAEVLEEDLIEAEAEASFANLAFESDFPFADGDIVVDADGQPFDFLETDELTELLLDEFDFPFENLPFDDLVFDDDVNATVDEIARIQLDLLESTDSLDALTRAAGGDFAIEIGVGAYVVIGGDAAIEIVQTSLDDVDVPLMTDAEFGEYLFEDLGILQLDDGPLINTATPGRVLTGVAEVDGVELLVTADASSVDRSVDRIRTALWFAVPIMTAIVAALGWLLTSRSLRPVRSITEQAATISGGSLDARVPVPDSGDEVATLAVTVNEMLERLENDDRTRRRFVSDASHELRSPVAVMRNEAEVALEHPDAADVNELATAIADESQRMSMIIDDLLALARHDEGVPAPTSAVDLDDIVLAEAARSRRVDVDTRHVSGGRVRGRSDELARMVGHLLDNAARHAQTAVVVSLASDGHNVRLIVDDDGPGIPPAERARVFERFARLDAARTRDRGGAGLGLSVVQSIAHRSGGTVEVSDAAIGGARLIVNLPAV